MALHQPSTVHFRGGLVFCPSSLLARERRTALASQLAKRPGLGVELDMDMVRSHPHRSLEAWRCVTPGWLYASLLI